MEVIVGGSNLKNCLIYIYIYMCVCVCVWSNKCDVAVYFPADPNKPVKSAVIK